MIKPDLVIWSVFFQRVKFFNFLNFCFIKKNQLDFEKKDLQMKFNVPMGQINHFFHFRRLMQIFVCPTEQWASTFPGIDCPNSTNPTLKIYFRTNRPFERSTFQEIRSFSSKMEFSNICSTSKSSTWVETSCPNCRKICSKICRDSNL